MRLYGKNPVIERIKANPKSIKKIYLQKGTDLSVLVKELKSAGMIFESVDKTWFRKECGDIHSQGVLAVVDDFEYSSYREISENCLSGKTVPVFLDGITDPQNLGGIIRSLACMGGFSLVIPEHGSVNVNETVLRIANGGENYLKIAVVPNIATAMGRLRHAKVTTAGAVSRGGAPVSNVEIHAPAAIAIGAEGKGIRPGVEKCLDEKLTLPMNGAELSYNVSVAAALFCHEIKKRLKDSEPLPDH